jgi:hypothetical protein
MAPVEIIQAPVAQAQSLNEVITDKARENGVNPTLASKIAYCESTDRQFNDSGKPLQGERNPKDIGLFQINEKYHLKTSQDLGYDIYTTEGNIGYAMWLLKNEGSQHWDSSKPCWGKKA